MKKIIFKFWIINILISIALFVTYTIVIAQKNSIDRSWLDTILYILDIGFSIIYLAIMVFGSLTFFLNQIQNVRKNYFLSLLTFLAIPSLCVIYFVAAIIDIHAESPLTTFAVFAIIYLFLATIEFLLFRKKIKSIS